MFVHTVEVKKRGESRETKLTIAGKATSDHEERMHAVIFTALHDSSHLVVNLQKMKESDLSFVTVLCAAHCTAERLGRKLTVQGSVRELLSRHASHAFPRKRSCNYSGQRQCPFWDCHLTDSGDAPPPLAA